MVSKQKKILIRSGSLLVLIILFIVVSSNVSFAKILTINLDDLRLVIPDLVVDSSQEVKNGTYVISCSDNDNFVLDVSGPSTENSAKLNIWQRTEAPNQKFYITYEEDGYYKIASINSAKIIDVPNASVESGVQIQQYEDNGTDAQRFKIIKNEDGTYSFISKCSGMALDVYGAIFENGGKVQQYEINGTNAQKFNLEKTELINDNVNGGIISIKTAKNPKMQIDMINCSSEEGNKAHLWENAATLAQRFEMHRVGENEIRIRTAASGGWLNGSSSISGADVVQIGNNKTEASNRDIWKVEWDEGIILVNKESGLALTVNGDINVNGTEIKLMNKMGNDAQKLLINTEYLIPTGEFSIQSKFGTMLDFPNNNQGTHLQTWSSTGTSRQIFNIEYVGDGYKIKSPVSGYVLDVYDGSTLDAVTVQMERDAGTRSQRWIPILYDGGYIGFKNANSGKYLDVANGVSTPGGNVQQYEENNTDAQKWKLVPTQLNEFTNAWGDDWHTDKVYLVGIIDRANRVGSDTDWFIAVDVGKFRVTLLHKVNNLWMVDGCFNATMGNMNDGTGRSCTGLYNMNGLAESNWQVTHKLELCNGTLRWFVAYIDHYKYVNGNRVEDSQGFHNHYEDAGQSFSSGGCPRLTDEHAKYLYDNVPIGTRVHIWHEY